MTRKAYDERHNDVIFKACRIPIPSIYLDPKQNRVRMRTPRENRTREKTKQNVMEFLSRSIDLRGSRLLQ